MSPQNRMRDAPLAGLVVVEIGTVVSAPYCGRLLADSGATVIKVESPQGDPFRGPEPGSPSPAFAELNHGKLSVTADLSAEHGREKVDRIVAQADVLLTNLRIPSLSKYGLDAPRLLRIRPTLIHGVITGLGPAEVEPVYDPIALGLSGLWSQLTDLRAPEPVGPPFVDLVAGAELCRLILVQMIATARTGRGAAVQTSLLDAALALQTLAIARFDRDGVEPDRLTRARHSQTFAGRARDGRALTVHLSSRDDYWQAFLAATDAPDLGQRAEFATPAGRTSAYDLLAGEISTLLGTEDRDHWLRRFAEFGLPAAPILTLPEALRDDRVRTAPARRTTGVRHAPALGEHDREPLPISRHRTFDTIEEN